MGLLSQRSSLSFDAPMQVRLQLSRAAGLTFPPPGMSEKRGCLSNRLLEQFFSLRPTNDGIMRPEKLLVKKKPLDGRGSSFTTGLAWTRHRRNHEP